MICVAVYREVQVLKKAAAKAEKSKKPVANGNCQISFRVTNLIVLRRTYKAR